MAEVHVFAARVQRKESFLPRYVVVPADVAAGWAGPVLAMVSLNGSPAFPRRLHPWGKGSADWFFNLTEPQCLTAGVDTGSECTARIEITG